MTAIPFVSDIERVTIRRDQHLAGEARRGLGARLFLAMSSPSPICTNASDSTPHAVACCPASYAVMCFVMRASRHAGQEGAFGNEQPRSTPKFRQRGIWLCVAGIGDGAAWQFHPDASRGYGVIHSHHARLVASQRQFFAMLHFMEGDVKRPVVQMQLEVEGSDELACTAITSGNAQMRKGFERPPRR